MYLILFVLLAQTPEQEVENLNHESYVVRNLACERLTKLGESARPALKQAIASEVPEVKLRAEKILKILDVEAIWDSSRVSYVGDYDKKLLEQAFNASGEQIVLNDTILQHITLSQLKSKFNYQAAPFWPALDDLCLKTNSYYYHNFHNNQQKEFSSGYRKEPKAYSGSFKVSVISAVRRFSEEYNYGDSKSQITHDFKIKFRSEWENHANVLGYKNPIVVAAQIGKNNYAIGSTETLWHSINSYNVNRCLETDVLIKPFPSSAEKIDLLHVKWEFFASTGPKKLDLNIKTGMVDDANLEAIVKKLTADAGVYVLDLDFFSSYLFAESPLNFSGVIHVKMFDKDDNEFSLHSQGFNVEGGVLKFNGRFLKNEKNESNEPFRLEITYDSLYCARSLDFIFKDVAFPRKNW
jgi:hypothetical protein